MTTWIAITGPHSSGKTTIGRLLAGGLGWTFDDEIGERLRRRDLAADPEAHAGRTQPEFDAEVCRLELARDRERLDTNRVVETWHPGNLAYARSRSMEVFPRLLNEVAAAVAAVPVRILVQPLAIDRGTILARRSEPGPWEDGFAEYMLAIGRDSAATAARLGLTVLPVLPTDSLDPQRCADLAAAAVRRHLADPTSHAPPSPGT